VVDQYNIENVLNTCTMSLHIALYKFQYINNVG